MQEAIKTTKEASVSIEWGLRRTSEGKYEYEVCRTCGRVNGFPFWWDDDAAAMAVEVGGVVYYDAYDVAPDAIDLFRAIDAVMGESAGVGDGYDEF